MAPYPKKWAILVGVTEYEHYDSLQFSTRDVARLSATLQTDHHFDKVIEFHDDGPPPERDGILHCLGELAAREQVGEDDLLLFYFSGHGSMEPKEKKDHLLPKHASPYALKDTGLKVEDVVGHLSGTGCKNIVLFIDACRNLPGDSGSKGAKSVAAALGENTKTVVRDAGLITFFSCAPEERSWEIEELEHGSFTYCLLGALRGQKGWTVTELNDHLRKAVPDLNKAHQKPEQRPYLIASPAQHGVALFGMTASGGVLEPPDLVSCLAGRYIEGRLEPKYYEPAVRALRRPPPPDDLTRKRQRAIADYCGDKLGDEAFVAAWEAIDRTLNSKLGTKPEQMS